MTDSYAERARRDAESFFENQRIARRALEAGADPLAILRGAVLEAIASALPSQWDRRAEVLEAARPRPGDYFGKATLADLDARDRRLAADAARCRLHAAALRGDDLTDGRHAADVELCGLGTPAGVTV